MTDLPSGWEWTTVGEAGKVELGMARSPARHHGPNMRPYLRVANVFEDRIDLDDVKEMHFSPAEFDRYSLRPGDILLNEGQSPELLGRPALYRGEPGLFAFTNSLLRFQAHADILPEWALLVFRRHMHSGRFAREVRITTNIAHLSAGRFKGVEFPVPPVDEQRRILSVVGEVLSDLGLAFRATTQAAQRAAEARLALKNKLVEDAQQGSADSTRLIQILSEPMRNGFSGRATTAATGVRTLTLTAVTRNDFRDEFTKNAEVGGRDIDGLWLQDGDIFVQRSNTAELVGTSATYHGPGHWSIFPDLLIRVRVNEHFDPDYVQAVLSSRKSRDFLRRLAKGLAGSMPKIDQGTLGSIEIPMNDLARQRELVVELRAQEAELMNVEEACAHALRRGAALERSVLRAAMTGDLGTTDPADEPACVLLESIRPERAAAPVAPARRRREP